MGDTAGRRGPWQSHTCSPEECGHDGETCPRRYDGQPTRFGQPYDPRLDATARHGSRHPVDVLADQAEAVGCTADPLELGHMRLVCDEQVGRNGESTGMWEFPQALPRPVLQLVTAFCVGVTERRPPNQKIGRDGSPYIDRWFLARKAQVPVFSGPPDFGDAPPFMPSEIENLYLHGYHRGDADEPHDHPWPNASLVVRGWYRESIYDGRGQLVGTVTRRAGDIVLRRSSSVHAILETSDDCLSLFATLPKERDWGFHTAAGFVPWQNFEHGAAVAPDQER